MRKRTETQLKAERAFRARNRGKARLPGAIYLDERHEKALERIAQHYGSKSAAILAAIINEAERLGNQPQGEQHGKADETSE